MTAPRPHEDSLVMFLHPAQRIAFKAAGMIEEDEYGEFIQCSQNGRIVVRLVEQIPCTP